MKKFILSLLLMVLAGAAQPLQAQYYEIANQLPQLIRPALSGSLKYKGFAEAGYMAGIGGRRASTLDFSTTQGFQYASWFFMGVGAGVDVMFSQTNEGWGEGWAENGWHQHSDTKTAVMIPLYTDFRFTAGGNGGKSPSFFFDLRIGASFLIGNDYVRIGDGYLTKNECFYLRPSAGVRIPIDGENSRKAVNFGISYQLLTQNYWYGWSSSIALSSIGANVSFEW